jgi:hypothetical protein
VIDIFLDVIDIFIACGDGCIRVFNVFTGKLTYVM